MRFETIEPVLVIYASDCRSQDFQKASSSSAAHALAKPIEWERDVVSDSHFSALMEEHETWSSTCDARWGSTCALRMSKKKNVRKTWRCVATTGASADFVLVAAAAASTWQAKSPPPPGFGLVWRWRRRHRRRGGPYESASAFADFGEAATSTGRAAVTTPSLKSTKIFKFGKACELYSNSQR